VTSATLFKFAAERGWQSTIERHYEVAEINFSGDFQFSSTKLVRSCFFTLSDGDLSISSTPPAKRNYVMANVVTAGTYNVLAGSGGTLKTMLMIIAAAAMAAGQDFGDLQLAKGGVMLFLGEEDRSEVSRRLSAVCMHYGFDSQAVRKMVKAFPAAGFDLRLTKNIDGSLHATKIVSNVIELANEHVQTCGQPVRLIVFDHARLVMDGDPDDAAHVTQLTRALTQIAQATGAAVMLLAHSPKRVLQLQSGQMSIADVAGSSAFSDNARSGFLMYGMREDDAKELQISDVDRKKYVKLECAKANYGPQGTEWWFEKVTLDDWQVQVLNPVSLIKPKFQQGRAKQQLQQRILDYIRLKPGRSKRHLRDLSGRHKTLGASESEVLAAMDLLLETGQLEQRRPTTDECAKHRLARGWDVLFVPQA
jgi:RecA-family ATPase